MIAPHSNVVVTANASIPLGVINKVDFFANSTQLGTVNGGGQISVNWNDVPNGKYLITAVATDGSGITTTSAPVSMIISSAPTINITSPQDGASFGASPVLTIAANVQDDDSIIDKVTFYANGIPLGTGWRSGINDFTFTWRGAMDGIFSLTAAATDQHGLTTTSTAITIGVNTPSPRPGEFVWFDDALPSGALTPTSDEGWHWVTANPGALSGTKSHQSRNFGQLQSPNSFHQHYFDGASTTLPVNAGDKLFTYVFLDLNNLPREIMLQWKDANGWAHRAYWGENRIDLGTDGTSSRFYMGPLPQAGRWARLEVPANAVGLEGATLYGMAFSLDGGRATFELAGKTTANAPRPPTTEPGDFVWIEDAPPPGAVTAVIDDHWNWVSNPHYSGQVSHVTLFDPGADKQFRSHSFTGAQTPMQVNPGDVLFTYVYLGNPSNSQAPYDMPDQIMLQWYDGSSWEHRAFWGVNFIGARFSNLGVQGTEGQRYMGGLPPARGWYRLEVPASYVGLEGKAVSGMAFTAYRNNTDPFVAWDRSGKSSALTSVPLNLSSTSGVWRSFSRAYGYAFETPDVPPAEHQLQKISFYVHPNQAAGTVPMHRFRRPGNYEYFYHTCRTCPGNDWQYEGVAFYVYPDASTPGTVPLYLYRDRDNNHKYVLTTDYNEAIRFGMINFDGIWGYVFSVNPQIPSAPTQAQVTGCYLSWRDNSASETGFRIEELNANTGAWSTIGSVGPNVRNYCLLGNNQCGEGSCMSVGNYRVQAYNGFGNSGYSNVASGQSFTDSAAQTQSSVSSETSSPSEAPPNTSPYVNIIARSNEQIAEHDLAISANSYDLEGAGTIVKVEFFADDNKLGEVVDVPYVFIWNSVAPGTYSLTAIATDNAGATTTSAPMSVTVNVPPTVSITNPASGTVFNSPATISINATAVDADGSINKVEFFEGLTKLGEDTGAPYSFVCNNFAAGNYVLAVVATDNLGGTTTSGPVSITVNAQPTVSITLPANGAVFTAPAEVSLSAIASDADGTVEKVDFYQGATLLGTDMTSPYTFTWANVSSGSYSITAKATDNAAGVTTSTPITLIVNALPNVSISSPTNGSSFVAPADFIINAAASDDGSISKVEFFQGAALLSTDTVAPYSFNWINVPLGSYSLTSKATDNLGATTTSNSINITVVQGGTSNKIAFASNREGIAQIYSMNSDGSNVFRLTASAANDEAPKWSPNNSRILFQSDRDNPFCDVFDIYSMNSDGSGQTRLTTDINDDRAPVWSPDGTKIAFQSLRNGVNYQVYMMNADGSGQVNISNSTSNDTQPSWSPDGTRIAFASDRDQPGFPSIYVMNANGSNQTRLTVSGSGFLDDQPAWSLDGTKLAFTSTRDSTVSAWEEWILREGVVNKEIYVMNADGSSQARLTNKMGNDDSPAWSPDGTRIAFRSDRDRNCCDPYEQVWVMNADGSNQSNLSDNQFGDHCPNWSR